VVGGYCGLVAEALAGVGLVTGMGLGIMVAAGVTVALGMETDLARNIGVWTYEDGQLRVAQTVLDVINRRAFQAKAKDLVMVEFRRRLRACMEQLADLRDPSLSTRPEARAAMGIQARVGELQRSLGKWFSHFVCDQVGRDPWLVPPPEDLRTALSGDTVVADSSSDSEGSEG